jgi:glycosyltransferase involved in cell wall biosynthesis
VITPLGVDLRDFPLSDAPERTDWSWRLLFVGRLDPGKGVDTLVRAMALLPAAATLQVVGPTEPAHVARLEALVASLRTSARVTIGSAPRDRLADAYHAADVCVFPSEWEEPFGIVPLEAMACGTPVVATGAGGSSEYLRDGENCVCFEPADANSLASAVRRLAEDEALRAHVVAGGVRTAARLTVDRLADQLEEVYRRAAGTGRRPPRGVTGAGSDT